MAVLGRVGMNFGAGMTGGLAWVYDADGSFVRERQVSPEFLAPEGFGAVSSEAQESLRALIERHVEQSESGLARTMLADWPESAAGFVRLTPKPQA